MKRAKKILCILLTLVMVLGMCPATALADSSMPFTDVKVTDWFYKDIQFVYENNLMSGTGENTFSPDATTTRGMIVTILYRLAGQPKASGEVFADVPAGQYYSDAVAWASRHGIVGGYGNGSFGPNDPITREQMAAILYRYARYATYSTAASGDVAAFADGDQVSEYAVAAMNWAIGKGLITGMTGKQLEPAGTATRGQVSAILTRFCDAYNVFEPAEESAPSVPDSSDHPDAEEPEETEALVLDFVSDNGALVLCVEKTQGGTVYGLWQQMNEGSFEALLSATAEGAALEFSLDVPAHEGVYRFKVIGGGSESNTLDYVVSTTGSGPISSDTDGDLISDELEAELGANPQKADTDGDGLPDGAEYYVFNTDALKADTDDNGTTDAAEDFDDDGLTNIEEYELGTDPSTEDSDDDGLADKDELDTYKTDPLKDDTDDDGLTDSDELQLGLDPLKEKTDGTTPDSARTFEQDLSEDNVADELLSEENAAVPSLSVTAAGNINRTMALSASTSDAFGDSRALVGKAVDVSGSEGAEGMITFSLKGSTTYALRSAAMNTKLICKYNEDDSIDFLDTDHDVMANTLSAELAGDGTYYVMDVQNLFDELGLVMPTPAEEPVAIFSLRRNAAEELHVCNADCGEECLTQQQGAETYNAMMAQQPALMSLDETPVSTFSVQAGTVMAQADIVFIIDTTGSMGDEIQNVKNNISAFVDVLKAKGISAGLALLDYQDIGADGMDSTRIHKNGSSNWFYNLDDYKTAISGLYLGWGGDGPECAVDALEMARQMDMRSSAAKHFILVTDADYKVDNRYGITSMGEELGLLIKNQITCSVISPPGYEKEVYQDLYQGTNGIWANIYGNFNAELTKLADQIGEEIVGNGHWIYLAGAIPMAVKLDAEPVAGSTVDTDLDGVSDVDELGSLTPAAEIDLDELIKKVGKDMIGPTNFGTVKMYRYISNPTKVDTDLDSYGDAEDLNPRMVFKTPVVLLHGRSDNTADCYGVVTKAFNSKAKSQNNHYGSDTTQNGLKYTDVSTHTITSIISSSGKKKPENLGYELKHTYHYTENKNLFAFNYPNKDMTKQNATKFSTYLNNLAAQMQASSNDGYFYPTKQAKDAKNFEVVLIGHSNGGLVSRYYIENMGGSSHVDTLITIDTPHWGSGLADISDNLATCYPMDIDLNPENAIFGGSYYTYSSLNPWMQDKVNYINTNQTDPLNYTNHGSTKYYFLAGFDVVASAEVGIGYLDLNVPFDVDIRSSLSNFGQYEDDFRNSFKNNSAYGDQLGGGFHDSIFELKSSNGDNVVNNQSQFGLKFDGHKDSSSLLKRIPCNGYWMNIDTFMGHTPASHFHGENQHRVETIAKIGSILQAG